MIGWLKPAPAAPPLPASEVDPAYRRLRRKVFGGIFIGYAAYYLVRNNLALAIPDILKEFPQHSKAELGNRAHRPIPRLRGVEVPHGLGLGQEQPELLPAPGAAAFRA